MSDFKIEKQVPVPKSYRQHKYPFADMEVGDSFFVPEDDGGNRVRDRVAPAANGYGKPRGWKFTTRTVEGGARCWRIE